MRAAMSAHAGNSGSKKLYDGDAPIARISRTRRCYRRFHRCRQQPRCREESRPHATWYWASYGQTDRVGSPRGPKGSDRETEGLQLSELPTPARLRSEGLGQEDLEHVRRRERTAFTCPREDVALPSLI